MADATDTGAVARRRRPDRRVVGVLAVDGVLSDEPAGRTASR